ncbi:hypothetical protein [Microbacterium lacticum]
MSKKRGHINGFRPAPAGWRVLRFEVYSEPPIERDHIEEFPLAGWIDRGKEAIPAYWNNGDGWGMKGELWTADDSNGFVHYILGPGQELDLDLLNRQYHGGGYASRIPAA